jgi:hypothetical protein
MREIVSEVERPVMMYSVGKDSAVMLDLSRKAFFLSPPPFPLLHVVPLSRAMRSRSSYIALNFQVVADE